MIWLAVFPTLTVLNLALGDRLSADPRRAHLRPRHRRRPIVIYGLMPQLHRLRARILTRHASR